MPNPCEELFQPVKSRTPLTNFCVQNNNTPRLLILIIPPLPGKRRWQLIRPGQQPNPGRGEFYPVIERPKMKGRVRERRASLKTGDERRGKGWKLWCLSPPHPPFPLTPHPTPQKTTCSYSFHFRICFLRSLLQRSSCWPWTPACWQFLPRSGKVIGNRKRQKQHQETKQKKILKKEREKRQNYRGKGRKNPGQSSHKMQSPPPLLPSD